MTPLDAWLTDARAAVLELVDEGQPFTSDAVWERVGPLPVGESPKRLAQVLTSLQREGCIVPTERQERSRRPERHGGLVRVWIPAGLEWARWDALPVQGWLRDRVEAFAASQDLTLDEATARLLKSALEPGEEYS